MNRESSFVAVQFGAPLGILVFGMFAIKHVVLERAWLEPNQAATWHVVWYVP
jgi:hypothetical protein